MKERRQMSSAHGGVLIRTGISPFAQGSLDKAFGLAIGARSVRAGEEMAESRRAASLSPPVAALTGANVGHDAFDLEAQGAEVSQGGMKELDGAVLSFIGHDAGEGH